MKKSRHDVDIETKMSFWIYFFKNLTVSLIASMMRGHGYFWSGHALYDMAIAECRQTDGRQACYMFSDT